MPALRAVGLLGALAILIAGCQTDGGGPDVPRADPSSPIELSDPITAPPVEGGGTLRYALEEPGAIVPPEATDSAALVVVDALFDSLTTYDADLSVIPAAATSWESNETATVWTFILRDGATFHDGSPVTAADFKFGWEEAVRLDRAGYHLGSVSGYDALLRDEATELAGVEVIDPRTLRVHLSTAFADFPAVVAHPALGPVPRGPYEQDGVAYREQPVGNGPFLATEARVRGQFIRLARFDDWSNGTPVGLDEVVFQITDPTNAYVAFQQGRIDVTLLPTGALDAAVEQYGLSENGYGGSGVLRGSTAVLYYLAFNVTRAPFDDPRIRRAVSRAIDREDLAATILEGNIRPARSVVAAVLPGGRRGVCHACVHDPEQAARVLSDEDLTQLTLWFNRGGGHEPVARAIREDLAALDIRLVLRTEEFDAYLDVLSRGEAAFFRFGWAPDYPIMDNILFPLFHSSQIPGAGEGTGRNYSFYADPDVDRLLEAARGTLDEQERLALYRRAETLALARDQVIAPLFTFRHSLVVSDRVEGFRIDPLGRVDLTGVSILP